MPKLKTKETNASVTQFLNSFEGQKKEDALVLLELFSEITKETPKLWGSSIIGFGNIHYKYASGREGDWFAVGFSPRKANLTLYVLASFEGKDELLAKLGNYKTGKSCLYLKKLTNVDLSILKKIIKKSYAYALEYQTVC